ncbi:MAG TPA: hypothetical protein DCP63_02310 [Bacteroidetes bacterium]|nr:hypothetical protein [Bacteroidota bacterium]
MTGLLIVVLGYKFLQKVREMSAWSKDEDDVPGRAKKSLPTDLKSLKLNSDNLEDLEKPNPPSDSTTKPSAGRPA